MVMTENNTMERYTLEDFKEICQSGFDYHINDETLDIISELSALVGAPDYIKTPNFNSSSIGFNNGGNRERNRQGGGRRRRRQHEMSDEDWEDLRTFHTKPKAAISPEKALEKKYRGELNKMVAGYEEEQFMRLIETFKEYKSMTNNESAEQLFFDTATCSKMNTKLFADIMCEMIQRDDDLNEIFSEYIPKFIDNKWLNTFAHILCVSEDEDYDKFCDTNRVNERRYNTSCFIGQFFKMVLLRDIEDYYWFDTIKECLNTIFESFDEELMRKDNEDIAFICCNNLFAFFTPIYDTLLTSSYNIDKSTFALFQDTKNRLLDMIDEREADSEYRSLTRKIIFSIQDQKF
jgi:hypothetical protein